MVVPHAVLASGWIPFVVVIVLALIFAWTYIRHYQHHELSELSTTLISILALFVTLLTTGLVPVDVFLVSYMKDSSGSYKSWASDPDARKSIEDTITLAYYALYATVAFFIFIILPFMYFYYEEKDDDVSVASRCCSALKFTCVFLLIAIVILFVGAFVPLRPPPKNMTAVGDKFNYLKDELKVYSHGEQCISIMVGVLSLFGMSLIAVYTSLGRSHIQYADVIGSTYLLNSHSVQDRTLSMIENATVKDRRSTRILCGRALLNTAMYDVIWKWLPQWKGKMRRTQRMLVDRRSLKTNDKETA